MAESAGVAVGLAPPTNAAGPFTIQLFEAWVQHLAETRLGVPLTSAGGDLERRTLTFGEASGSRGFELASSGLRYSLSSASGLEEVDILATIRAAAEKSSALDTGGEVIYEATMAVEPWDPIRGQMHLLRTLGDQQRIQGARRLSVSVILDFEEDASDIVSDD